MTSLNKVSRSRPSLVKQASIHDLEVAEMQQAIAPKVDGRIFHLNDEVIITILYTALIWSAKDFVLQPCWRVFLYYFKFARSSTQTI